MTNRELSLINNQSEEECTTSDDGVSKEVIGEVIKLAFIPYDGTETAVYEIVRPVPNGHMSTLPC